QLLARVREVDLAAFAHADVPFERLVEALQPARSLARHPLFQVMLALQNNEQVPLDLPGLTTTPYPVDAAAAKFDLTVTVVERRTATGEPDGLDWSVEYATDLFDVAAGQAVTDRLHRVVLAVLAEPHARLSAIDLTHPAERLLLATFTGTRRDAPRRTLPHLFEEQVRATPDATAVRCADEQLTYRQLDAAADRLAGRLIDRGAGCDRLVVIALPRSVDMLVALWGVLKAGAAYLPLDLTLPAARVTALLDEARPVCAVTTATAADRLPDGMPWLTVDTRTPALPDEPTTSPRDTGLLPDHLAYTVFTSGSTGRPKAVAVTHANVAALLDWAVGELGRDRFTAVLATTSLSFDVSVFDTVLPLLAGGQVRILPDVLALADTSYPGSLLCTVPSAMAALLARGVAPRVGMLALAGEALPADLVRQLRRVAPGTSVANIYGPTEATVYATAWHDDGRVLQSDPPIGRPLRHTRAYVLDRWLRPTPIGVAGDLYLVGAGVARGYLHRSSRSAESFVACPFGDGERMYRTGDVVRWTADGHLEYLGRTDDQVKVRGFRVELGEVAAVLRSHADIADATATVRPDAQAGHRLIAYVAPRPHTTLDTAAILAWVAERLPAYSVPALVVVAALPRTASGKVDRAQLPAPQDPAAPAGQRPRDETEAALCDLIADLLERPTVGVDDDFFQLGGHSLLAMRLTGRIRAALGVDVGVRAVFEAPTVAQLVRLIRVADTAPRPPLVARPRPSRLPVSSAQRRLWFLHRLDGQSGVNNIGMAVRLVGGLDVEALRTALRDVTQRQESLRTVFVEVDGEPCQVVLDPDEVRLDAPVVEAAPADLDAALAHIMTEPFDLATDPPLRVGLWRESPDVHVLVLVLHHIAADGWSLAPLARDVVSAYAARAAGHPPRWQPLPVQYADYALWQRDLLGGDDPDGLASRQLAFWTRTLDALPDTLPLPADRPRPAHASHRAGLVEFVLEPSLVQAVRRLAQHADVSVFMVLHAALVALLSRLGAGVDVPVGSPVAGRTDAAVDDVVGFFVNTVVLRADVSGDPTFAQLLARVREVDLAAFAHADVPFERLVEALQPARSLARHPLFQVLLNLQNNVDAQVTLPAIDVSVQRLSGGVSPYDLKWSLGGQGAAGVAAGAMAGALEYASDLFTPETARALVSRYTRILTAAVTDPTRRIADLGLLDDSERQLTITDWNDTGHPWQAGTLPALFAAQVARTPAAPALTDAAGTLTYTQVDEQSNRLAHHLISLGVGPEDVVAVLLPRSARLVTAVHAVTKTGAAYVAVEPGQPAQRLAGMLTDTGVRVVVTVAEAAGAVPPGRITVVLDDPATVVRLAGTVVRAVEDADRSTSLLPEHPAYVMFTSGSTGRPKGVLVSHASITHLLAWLQASYPLGPGDRVLHKTPVGFTVSVWELFWPLQVGACTVVARPGGHRDLGYLTEVIQRERITAVHFVPTVLAALLDQPDIAHCSCVRRLFVGGEGLTTALRDRARDVLGAAVHYKYGSTEVTIDAGCWDDREDPGAGSLLPLGRPIWNTRMYVLDARLRPVPPGVPGELYVVGRGLARGYVGRPGSTAERFIADPYSSAGGRMYRTGDVVRWRADGNLEFVGRADAQLTLRGARIEPAEVEVALTRHPAVARAAVLIRPGAAGIAMLVGYVVPSDPDRGIDVAQVRRAAAAFLPEYMVPAAVIAVDTLPLTSNGKLDRAALPPPSTGAQRSSAAPATAMEEALCTLVAEVLDVAQVGTDEDFFALGGHSLLATRLVNRVRSALGVELELKAIFDSPTVAGLAARLGDPHPGPRSAPRPASDDGNDRPLSFAQYRMWFLGKLETRPENYHIPVAMRLSGPLDHTALQHAVSDVVARHETLRSIIVEQDGSPRLRVLTGPAALVRMSSATVSASDLPAELARVTAVPFDLSVAPPVRAHLCELGGDEYVLLVVVHHLAADGWSLAPLARDLVTAYAAHAAGRPPSFAPLAMRYADFVRWQRDLLGSEDDPGSVVNSQLAYWRAQLSDLPAELSLPTDRPRPKAPSHRGASIEFDVPAPRYDRL
ncbi:MAG: hypothetical protein QOE03_474, partial [Micromonosporaceae bacterium]|nr:hypothetical protein [Micromonosporaceae bacterium]